MVHTAVGGGLDDSQTAVYVNCASRKTEKARCARGALTLDTRNGPFAAWDFGGDGPDVLLVHGTGHNLTAQFRVAAFDMRGHGQTPVESTNAERYWRDLAEVSSALGVSRPLLVGHSTGGYAVTAFAGSGGECSAVVALDGLVLDGRKTPEEEKDWYLPTEQLWDLFRYGWVASPDEVDAYVQEVCLAAANDWLNAGIDVSVVAAFTRRSFLKDGASFVRRPTMEEIAMVSVPDSRAEIYPSVDLYSRIAVPLGLVLAEKGLYGHREKDVMAIVGNHPDRHFIKLESGHNVHMQKPEEIARFITRNFL